MARVRRIAALYDIHGNLPALEAVLREVREAQVDEVVIGGDVLPGPMPRECLERVLQLEWPTRYITGNGDREVLARMRGIETGGVPEPFRELIRWSGEQIPDYEAVLASWPATLTIDIDGLGQTLFCHATPRNDVDMFTRLTAADRLRPLFDPAGVPLVICGHTHMQFDRTIGPTRVINAGSVGMSFQGPGAYWLLLTPNPNYAARRTTSPPPRIASARRSIRRLKNSPPATSWTLHRKRRCSTPSAGSS